MLPPCSCLLSECESATVSAVVLPGDGEMEMVAGDSSIVSVG